MNLTLNFQYSSIRANQEVETLRNQIRLLEKQRDEVQARLSEAEDAKSRSEAALTNLQVVLEQFQLGECFINSRYIFVLNSPTYLCFIQTFLSL